MTLGSVRNDLRLHKRRDQPQRSLKSRLLCSTGLELLNGHFPFSQNRGIQGWFGRGAQHLSQTKILRRLCKEAMTGIKPKAHF